MNGSLKFSIAVSVLILAIGGALGLRSQQRLTTLRGVQRDLAVKAEALGIATADAAETPVTKRQREDRANQVNALALDLIAFAKEVEMRERQGGEDDKATAERGLEIQARLMALDAARLKELIDALRDDQSLSQTTRLNMIGISITMLGEDHPAAALELFSESYDLLGDTMIGGHVVSTTLEKWAKKDPSAAWEWVRQNAAKHPELADDTAKRGIVAGVGASDPKLAFKLIGEMQIDDTVSAVGSLVEAGKTPEQRTAILEALHGYLETIPETERADLFQESLESMGRNLANESFDSVRSWIEKSKLTPEQSAQFAAGLSYFNTKQDTGRWIDWLGENLPKDAVAESVDNLVGQWTQQDYLAAGRWLSAAPDGPAKQAAVSTYAGTVAEYEPQTAVQWALTLTDEEERQATFEAIYQNWPASDAAAAEAFAKEHGIPHKLGRNSIDAINKDGKGYDAVLPPVDDENDPIEEP